MVFLVPSPGRPTAFTRPLSVSAPPALTSHLTHMLIVYVLCRLHGIRMGQSISKNDESHSFQTGGSSPGTLATDATRTATERANYVSTSNKSSCADTTSADKQKVRPRAFTNQEEPGNPTRLSSKKLPTLPLRYLGGRASTE